MTLAFVFLCVSLYVAASGVISSRLFHTQGPNLKLSIGLALPALLIHFTLLADSIFIEPGQNMSMTNVASLIASLITFSMILATLAWSNVILLPVVFGFSAFIVLINALLPSSYIMQIGLEPNLVIHISLALFAYGSLIIACLYALQVSYINSRLKQKQASLLHSSLPPLMLVEQILFKLLTVGVVLLSLSLLSGFVFLDNMFAKELAHKTVLSILAWFGYVCLLIGHFRLGWRGSIVTKVNIAGAILLTLAYFGSRLVREVLLS